VARVCDDPTCPSTVKKEEAKLLLSADERRRKGVHSHATLFGPPGLTAVLSGHESSACR
jgi:hypothetical protein